MQRNMSKYEMKLRVYMKKQLASVKLQEDLALRYLDAKNKNTDLKNELENIRKEISRCKNGSTKKSFKFGGAHSRDPSHGSASNAALTLNQI